MIIGQEIKLGETTFVCPPAPFACVRKYDIGVLTLDANGAERRITRGVAAAGYRGGHGQGEKDGEASQHWLMILCIKYSVHRGLCEAPLARLGQADAVALREVDSGVAQPL